jgi:hypothetical protein
MCVANQKEKIEANQVAVMVYDCPSSKLLREFEKDVY